MALTDFMEYLHGKANIQSAEHEQNTNKHDGDTDDTTGNEKVAEVQIKGDEQSNSLNSTKYFVKLT